MRALQLAQIGFERNEIKCSLNRLLLLFWPWLIIVLKCLGFVYFGKANAGCRQWLTMKAKV